MSDERLNVLTPEEIAEKVAARKRSRSFAILRLVGSALMSAVMIFKLATYPNNGDATLLIVWISGLVVALGIASFDQFLKAIGR